MIDCRRQKPEGRENRRSLPVRQASVFCPPPRPVPKRTRSVSGHVLRGFLSRGFTLVEALLSIVVICIGTIFILQAFGQELTSLGLARDNTRASLLLEEKMEELEQQIRQTGNLNEVISNGKFTVSGEKEFNWTLNSFPSTLSDGLTEVWLSCFWQSKGKTHSIDLVTFVRETEDE